jgi:SAM-dependent methyltransferase
VRFRAALIPLLRTGLTIDGVDSSTYVLDSCRKRCKDQHLSVNLYNQSIQNLSLPQKYSLIFIAIGSFQLIHNRDEALHVFENLRANLLPGGKLVIETFVPWDGIKDAIHDSILSDQLGPITLERKVETPDGFEIVNHSTVALSLKNSLKKRKRTL